MPPTETFKDIFVQASTDISDQATFTSPDCPADRMNTHSDITGGVSAALEPPFRFMDLPAELRNIYRQHFAELDERKQPRGRTMFGSSHGCNWPKNGQQYLSILRANRQIWKEAAPIFYSEYIGNADADDKRLWVLTPHTQSTRTTIAKLLAIARVLKKYSPGAEVEVAGNTDDSINLSLKAIRMAYPRPGAFRILCPWRRSGGYYFSISGQLGQGDWSALAGLWGESGGKESLPMIPGKGTSLKETTLSGEL